MSINYHSSSLSKQEYINHMLADAQRATAKPQLISDSDGQDLPMGMMLTPEQLRNRNLLKWNLDQQYERAARLEVQVEAERARLRDLSMDSIYTRKALAGASGKLDEKQAIKSKLASIEQQRVKCELAIRDLMRQQNATMREVRTVQTMLADKAWMRHVRFHAVGHQLFEEAE